MLAYTRRLRPKGVPFARFRYEKVVVSLVSAYKKDLLKDLKGLTSPFYGSEKDNKTFWFSELFFFKKRCKRDAAF